MEGEQALRAEPPPCPWTLVRPTSIWGPWFGVPYLGFFQAVARGRYLHPRGRRLLRSNGYVGNVVHQLLALLADPERAAGRVLFLADYEPTDVLGWARAISAATGAAPPREAPLWLMRALALVGDALKRVGMRNPPLTSERLRNLLSTATLDLSATRDLIGPLPWSLDDGVASTVAWMRGRGLIPETGRGR
jgi:nucleoside-diphosphate-sugar epimerase